MGADLYTILEEGVAGAGGPTFELYVVLRGTCGTACMCV